MAFNTQAISPSDLEAARDFFDAAGTPWARIRFAYDEATDCWELRDSDDDSVVASRPPPDVAWVEA